MSDRPTEQYSKKELLEKLCETSQELGRKKQEVLLLQEQISKLIKRLDVLKEIYLYA